MQTLLAALGQANDLRFVSSEAVRNYGFGRCRVTQVVIHWNPSLSDLGRDELATYSRALALSLGCELVDLWVEPHHVDEFGPDMVAALTDRAADYARLGKTLERVKRQRSEAATANLGRN